MELTNLSLLDYVIVQSKYKLSLKIRANALSLLNICIVEYIELNVVNKKIEDYMQL